MSAPKLVEPYGCGRCGIPLPHGQQTGPGGLHGWERPSDAQILARMKARRLARVVAREGALPMPSGPEPRDVEDELTGANLSLWEEEQTTARLRSALASAQRGRRELRAQLAVSEQRSERRRIAWRMARQRAISVGGAADRYAARAREGQTALQDMLAALLTVQIERGAAQARVEELLTERHSTNEALDDAAKALREQRDRIAELESRAPDGERPADAYPPALPWARLMDHEDLTEFLDELAASAITHASSETALAEVEETCGRWRLIAEAQHGHNTAPGPDGITRAIVPVQALREDDEFHLHHTYRVPRDLPEPAGVQTSWACKACGSAPDSWCPDCGACQRGCYDGFVDNYCTHAGASWVGVE